MKKVLKIAGLLLSALILFVVIWWFLPGRTPPIHSDSGRSISSLEYIKINGSEQCVLIRSQDTRHPILLFLHGGPGMPMMYMAHDFQRPLEKNYTVVQWDRRGAGKTYSRNKPEASRMNVRQLIDDAYALIDTLRNRYHHDKVVLVGHSFGTYLGSIMVTERPELFSAYISIGQVVDAEKSRKLQEKFIRSQVKKDGRSDILTALDQPDQPNLEQWLFEFGGELKHSKSFWPFIRSGLLAPEYTLPEVLNVASGSSFSSTQMKYNILNKSIYYEIREYRVPVYFFIGTQDYTTPHQLVQEYFNLISAPEKKLVYFEHSAHFPFFEEPDQFCAEINKLDLN